MAEPSFSNKRYRICKRENKLGEVHFVIETYNQFCLNWEVTAYDDPGRFNSFSAAEKEVLNKISFWKAHDEKNNYTSVIVGEYET